MLPYIVIVIRVRCLKFSKQRFKILSRFKVDFFYKTIFYKKKTKSLQLQAKLTERWSREPQLYHSLIPLFD